MITYHGGRGNGFYLIAETSDIKYHPNFLVDWAVNHKIFVDNNNKNRS